MKTILVVEDNNDIRNEISDIFKMENFNVIEAGNGLEGYIKATNNLPDIIISDIMMPVLDGYKMYNELKINTMTEQIPVIFISALSSDNDIRKGMNLGAEDYLKKPLNPDELIQATENKLDKYSKFAKRYDDVKTNITNVLYHELNTPLNGILGFSDYLRIRTNELSTESIKKIADNIYTSGVRLDKLVKRYLYYSELKMDSVNITGIKKLRDCDYIDTDTIINKIVASDEYKNRKTDFELSTSPVDLKIKDYFLELLIRELIDNAVKFSHLGHKIFINSYIENNTFIINVKNEGSGLSKEKIMRINDFNQMNKKQYAQNGSGIGLSIIKLIMEIYGVDFEVDSIPNTFFSVTLSFKKFIEK